MGAVYRLRSRACYPIGQALRRLGACNSGAGGLNPVAHRRACACRGPRAPHNNRSQATCDRQPQTTCNSQQTCCTPASMRLLSASSCNSIACSLSSVTFDVCRQHRHYCAAFDPVHSQWRLQARSAISASGPRGACVWHRIAHVCAKTNKRQCDTCGVPYSQPTQTWRSELVSRPPYSLSGYRAILPPSHRALQAL